LDNTPLLAQSGFHSRLETMSILAARLVHDALFRAVEHILPEEFRRVVAKCAALPYVWFEPYIDTYDRSGRLDRNHIYWLATHDRPVPDAKVAIYPFKRWFLVSADSTSVQSGLATICYLPTIETPERKCWYINKGAVDKELLSPPTQWCGRPPSNLSHHLKRFRRLKGEPPHKPIFNSPSLRRGVNDLGDTRRNRPLPS
jgi:hypothetical protein